MFFISDKVRVRVIVRFLIVFIIKRELEIRVVSRVSYKFSGIGFERIRMF